ncbi:toll-like receptor 3 [Neolamprologus brichardi]|uniref:toll-like receptor 3 n=1 Tax=Neolamprologus brichardi TaxID=32507 RepID=UPI001643E379|nr:toll-like receptor 3 [Neolamprologus brichardi]
MSHSLVTLPLGFDVGLDYLPQFFFPNKSSFNFIFGFPGLSVAVKFSGLWTVDYSLCFLVVCVGLSCLLQRLIMDPELEEEQIKLERGTKCCKSRIIFYMLCIINFIAPVDGFSLKTCRISYSTAICVGSKLRAVPGDIPSTVTGLDLTSNRISTIHASDFKDLLNLTKLDLNINNISQIESGAFASLSSLETLNLNNNKLVTLGENVFDGLSCLIELRINQNRIKQVASTSFKSMTSLKLLDISHNKLHHITKVQLILQHLPHLQELVISNNDLTTFQSFELTNKSLEIQYLDLSKNPLAVFRITADVFPNLTWFKIGSQARKKQMIWDVQNKTFLSRVTTLDISELHLGLGDMERLLESVNSSLTILKMNAMTHNLTTLINISCTIPTMRTLQLRSNKLSFVNAYLFKLCTNVTELVLTDNKIKYIHDDAFRSLKNLRILTLSKNRLPLVPAATRNLPTLSELDLSTNNISTLDCHDFTNQTKLRKLYLYQNSITALKPCLFKDLKGLQTLKLQTNQITKLNGAFKEQYTTLNLDKSLPALTYLDLQGNGFTCNCDNSWFLSWAINDSKTQVYDAYNFTCNYPQEFKSKKLLDLDTSSCLDNTDFICFVLCTCTILCLMVVSFTYHFMGLQLVYAYYLFIAWLFDKKHKNKKTPHQYDAFISYNTHDEPWVIDKLLPKLEGEQGWRLCLHHRDFEPGRPIIDNITDAIYGSRKTICVISRKYLESEWCSREIQAAR